MAKDLVGGDVTKDLGEVTDELVREGLVNHGELHNYSIALSFVKKLLAAVNMTNKMGSVIDHIRSTVVYHGMEETQGNNLARRAN